MEAVHRSEHLPSRSPESAPPQDRVRRRMEQVHGKLRRLLELGGLLVAEDAEALGMNGRRAPPSLEAFAMSWAALKYSRRGTAEEHLNRALRRAQRR